MANHLSDRQRMRNDLRELAKLAAAPSQPATPHAFDTADSSGYVDLSAFSARDPAWVDRELARAKRGGPPPLPLPPGSKRIDALSPASMAPVALESFVLADDTASVRPSRGRRVLFGFAGLAGVGLVAFLAVTIARHPPPAAANPPAAAAPAPSPSPAAPASTPADTAAAAAPAPSASPANPAATAPGSAPTTAAVASVPASSPTAKKKAAGHGRFHAVAASSPSPVAAAAPEKKPAAVRPVAIPASKPPSGNDSLMDLIKKSVASGK